MEQSKKIYTLGKIKQLIDLNGDSTNFDLSFKVTCADDTHFHVLVVDQETLDNNQELEYKKTQKTISGNIVTDKNILYQNYFLILKSDKECTVEVELIKKILPKPTENIQKFDQNLKLPKRTAAKPDSSEINWKKIGLISVVVLIGLGILWFLYKRKNKIQSDAVPVLASPFFKANPVLASPVFKASPVLASPVLASPVLASPVQSSHSYKPTHRNIGVKKTRVSPDIMSQTSHQSSSVRSQNNESNSLLYRLKKFSH